jgi:hypothetical protein
MMEKRKHIYLALMCMGLAFFMAGCSGYGKLRPFYGSTADATFQDLVDHWEDYTIHYFGWHPYKPTSIVFDPKQDNKTLENDGWFEVTNKEELIRLIKRVRLRRGTVFYRIFGPDDEPYGYLLSAPEYIYVKTVDENTLRLHGVRQIDPSSV